MPFILTYLKVQSLIEDVGVPWPPTCGRGRHVERERGKVASETPAHQHQGIRLQSHNHGNILIVCVQGVECVDVVNDYTV